MPDQNADNLAQAATTPGLWSFLGIVASGAFGVLAKVGWDRRRAAPAHGNLHAEINRLRQEWHDQQRSQDAKLEQILQAQNEDARDRATFRASIEATMATKDDLHETGAHLGDKLEAGLAAVHTRLNDHVRDYHLPRT